MVSKSDPDSPRDLASLPRAQLIRAGYEALGNKKSADAISYFGAAIRKAKRVQLWDVEAEFFKFATLYMEGNYPEAVNRCIECLDSVKLCSDTAQIQGTTIPRDGAIEKLENCLVQTMVMRRDSFFQLVSHFWQMQYGEYYLLKRPRSLIGALTRAWIAFSIRLPISYDMMKVDLQPFTAYLQTQLDAAKDMIESEDAQPVRGSQASASTSTLTDAEEIEREKERKKETHFADFLRKAREETIIKLGEDEVEKLHSICRSTRNVSNLGEICKIIDMLGPNSKKTYIAALAENEVMKSRDVRLSDMDAERLHHDVQEYIQILESQL